MNKAYTHGHNPQQDSINSQACDLHFHILKTNYRPTNKWSSSGLYKFYLAWNAIWNFSWIM